MTKAKWNEQCWNCGSRNMVDQGDYARCEDCGATATPLSGVGADVLESHYVYAPTKDGPKRLRSGSPNPSLIRKIELERLQKSAQGIKR